MRKSAAYFLVLAHTILPVLLLGQSQPASGAQATETLASTIANAANLDTPPVQEGDLRFNATFDTRNGVPPHKLVLLEDGPAALQARLWMIEHAQKEVDIETYYFETDKVGKILLQALAKKKEEMAREGKPFQVRILVDHLAVTNPAMNRYAVQELAKSGIEVKFYNDTLVPWKIDIRSHKKTFIVDGKHFIIGGRNTQDSYFGMDAKYNYLDTDVYVQGWAAGAAQGAFNDFWNSDLSETPRPPSDPNPADLQNARTILAPSPALQQVAAKVREKGTRELNDLYVFPANSVVFLSDKPFDEKAPRRTENWLMRDIGNAKSRVLMENWTFVPDRRAGVFQRLLARGVSVQLMTNSFQSKDDPVFYLSYPRQLSMVKKNMEISGYSGKPTNDPGLNSLNTQNATWGTHAKTACIDDRNCYVGSANLDPRSDNINAEAGVMVYNNAAFAVAVENGIRRRMFDSNKLEAKGRYQNAPSSQLQENCVHEVGPTSEQIESMGGLGETMREFLIKHM